MNRNLDYDRPIRLAEGVFWIGVYDPASSWMSSPYLIVDGDEAVLIDAGSRSDFAAIVMKLMQAGIVPSAITTLVYQNYYPRLWGSLQHFQAIIGREDLRIVSDRANLMFTQSSSNSVRMVSLDETGFSLRLSSGRCLDFIKTPFAHSAGSFVTFDRTTGILFTGDLFSSYSQEWSLLLKLKAGCRTCQDYATCLGRGEYCPIHDILDFHRKMMSSERALGFAMKRIGALPFSVVAPQRGSIIHDAGDIAHISGLLSGLKGVGIDGIIGESSLVKPGDAGPEWDPVLRCGNSS